jgi:ABC-type glycerol-3-phosphate transport system permease component
MSWGDFLRYASSDGIAVIVGIVLSVVIEYFPAYCELASKWKRLVFFALCMAMPILATVLAVATGVWGVWGDWQNTWWPAIVAGFTAGAAGTLVHTRKLADYVPF